MATLAEKLAAWRAARTEIRALRAAYFAKKAEAAQIYQQLQEKEAAFAPLEEDLNA
jgi:hypothetical protein